MIFMGDFNHRKYTRRNLHSSYDFRKKKSYKGLIIVIAIIVVLALVLAYDFGGVKTTIEKSVIKIQSNIKTNNLGLKNNECPNGIISESFILIQSRNEYKECGGVKFSSFDKQCVLDKQAGSSSYYIKQKWADNSEIGFYNEEGTIPSALNYANDNCIVGSNEGENINYLYCQPFTYSNTKTKIADEGTIEEKENINYKITLILERKPLDVELEYTCALQDMWLAECPIESRHLTNIITKHKIISAECEEI